MTRIITSWPHEVDNCKDVKPGIYYSHSSVPWKYILGTDHFLFREGGGKGGAVCLTNTAQQVKLSKTESETPPRHLKEFGQMLQAREVEGVQASQVKTDRYTGIP